MKKYLIVVDMQVDFVNGALGTREAEAIAPKVAEKIRAFDGEVIFTQDTHLADYLNTQVGRCLPIEHCIEGSAGWQLIPELRPLAEGRRIVQKPTFGSRALAETLAAEAEDIESIELVGLCTDICVVSNALLLKAFMPEVPIGVDPACCAGVTPAGHAAALATMRACQVNVR